MFSAAISPLHSMDQFDLPILCKSVHVSAFQSKLASGTSPEGHNVGKINWHISAMKVFTSMPRKFPACLCSVLSTDLTADRLSEGSVKMLLS